MNKIDEILTDGRTLESAGDIKDLIWYYSSNNGFKNSEVFDQICKGIEGIYEIKKKYPSSKQADEIFKDVLNTAKENLSQEMYSRICNQLYQ